MRTIRNPSCSVPYFSYAACPDIDYNRDYCVQNFAAHRGSASGARALGGPALGVEDRAALAGREGAADGVALALGEAEDDEAAAGAERGELALQEQRLA